MKALIRYLAKDLIRYLIDRFQAPSEARVNAMIEEQIDDLRGELLAAIERASSNSVGGKE